MYNFEKRQCTSTNQMSLTLGSLDFNEGEILKIITALNVNKAHDHDDISITMIKICDNITIRTFNYFI